MSRILILDDWQARHNGFKEILKGHDLTHVYSCEEFIAVMSGDKYDMLCLDHDLGNHELDGRDAVDWLVKNPSKCPAKILIHSWNIPCSDIMLQMLRSIPGPREILQRPFAVFAEIPHPNGYEDYPDKDVEAAEFTQALTPLLKSGGIFGWVKKTLKVLLAALSISCSSLYSPVYEISVGENEPEWVWRATELATDFWGNHGVLIVVTPDAPLKVRTVSTIPDAIGQCICGNAKGIIELRSVLGESKLHGDLSRSCVVAHEIGHALGMNHVKQGTSLMAPVLGLPGLLGWPEDNCPWSLDDHRELCGAEPYACE